MTAAPPTGVVVDTMVISWLFDERPNPLAERYRDLIGPAPVLLAFQTVMELRFGAIRAGWGELRRRQLERRLAQLTVLQPDDQMVLICAQLGPTASEPGMPSGTSCTTETAGSLLPPSVSVCRSCPTTACSMVPLDSSSSPPPSFELLLTSRQSPAWLPHLCGAPRRCSGTGPNVEAKRARAKQQIRGEVLTVAICLACLDIFVAGECRLGVEGLARARPAPAGPAPRPFNGWGNGKLKLGKLPHSINRLADQLGFVANPRSIHHPRSEA
jgi:predicted nucleic acid-binding protein